MKVILNQDVPNLGEEGDVCDVAPGYARNFLMPRGLVLMDNKRNRAAIEQRRAAIEKRKEEKRQAAMSIRERLESEELVFTMATGEKGKLFGSVNTQNISERLEKMGIDVERRRIDVPGGTIKSLGTHTVRIRLYGGEEAELKVAVRSESGEAEAQQSAEQQAEAKAAAAAAAEAETGSPEGESAEEPEENA